MFNTLLAPTADRRPPHTHHVQLAADCGDWFVLHDKLDNSGQGVGVSMRGRAQAARLNHETHGLLHVSRTPRDGNRLASSPPQHPSDLKLFRRTAGHSNLKAQLESFITYAPCGCTCSKSSNASSATLSTSAVAYALTSWLSGMVLVTTKSPTPHAWSSCLLNKAALCGRPGRR